MFFVIEGKGERENYFCRGAQCEWQYAKGTVGKTAP